MDPSAIQLEARLLAIEHLITKLYVGLFEGEDMTLDQVSQAHDGWMASARARPLPMDHPAISDHMTGEWEAALERLLAGQREMFAQAAATRPPR